MIKDILGAFGTRTLMKAQLLKIGYFEFCSIVCDKFGAKDTSKCLEEIAIEEIDPLEEYAKKYRQYVENLRKH